MDGTIDVDAKAKLAAELLSEEKKEKEKKSLVRSKKKKHRSNKVVDGLSSLFASLTFLLLSCNNECPSWCNRELQRAKCLVFFIRMSNCMYLSSR